MPKVGNKHFSYTREGIAAAKKEEERIAQKELAKKTGESVAKSAGRNTSPTKRAKRFYYS